MTQTNMTILSDMLTELSPGREHQEDRTLLEQLHGTCRAMQSRLVELIDQVDDDHLTADLLEVNDNMNNTPAAVTLLGQDILNAAITANTEKADLPVTSNFVTPPKMSW